MTETNYIELRAHSAYSLLRGTSPPESLVAEAAHLRLPGLALTDHNNVYGAVGFQKAAQALDIQPILGAELTIEGPSAEAKPPLSPCGRGGRGVRGKTAALTLLVANETGWENLCWLITQAQHQAPKGEGLLHFEQLQGRAAGLIALSGGREGEVARALESAGRDAAQRTARRYASLFDQGCFFIELHHHRRPYDGQRIAALAELAGSLKLDIVATNHVHYPTPAEKALGDVVTAIRHNCSLNAARPHLFPNGQHHLKSAEAMAALFGAYPRALSNTLRIAEACRYQLPSQLQTLPQYPVPDGMNARVATWPGFAAAQPAIASTWQSACSTNWTSSERSAWPTTFWSSGISCASPMTMASAVRGAARPPILS